MNIIIKQKEIEAGIKLFLLQQGIQLVGKSTEISFTAGRKDSGLSAEIEINDVAGAVSIVDTMIGQQVPVAPVILVPEAPVVPPAIAQAAKELGVEVVAAPHFEFDTAGAFMHDAVTEEEEGVQEAQAEPAADPVATAVNKLFEPVEDVLAEDEPEPEPEAVEVDAPWEADEVAVPVAAPAVKTVSLFS